MSIITDTDLFYQRSFYEDARRYMLGYSEAIAPLREKLKDKADISGIRIKDKGYEIRDLQAISWRDVEFEKSLLPRFVQSAPSISKALEASAPGLAAMLLTGVLSLAVSYFRFTRYSLL